MGKSNFIELKLKLLHCKKRLATNEKKWMGKNY